MPRITAQAKEETRQRILVAAQDLFTRQGFAETTTRHIAAASSIAAGTLFNYFATKEAVAMTLLAGALDEGSSTWREQHPDAATLEEALFGHIAALLRALAPHRAYVADAMALTLSPFARSAASAEGDAFRAEHLATVHELLRIHRPDQVAAGDPSFVSMHLYWTLFVGVLAFWSSDESPHQHDSLAVLDQSLNLFTASLPEATAS